MPEIAIVEIEISKPLPEKAVVDTTYKIEGSVKVAGAVGAPPWVYAEIRHKEWYKPEFAEEVEYERGFPLPITGEFDIGFTPGKEGDYEVKLIATPAPLPLPAIGAWPTIGESDVMKVAVGEKPAAVFRFAGVTLDGNEVSLTDHDADSGLLLDKTTADFLDIIPSFEWVGSKKSATISIKAGHRDWAGGFSPKTDAYTRTIELPESPTVPYSGKLEDPIRIPLIACGDISDGAIEMVLKIAGEPDYISRIWNVYATKVAVVAFRFSSIIIDGNEVSLTDRDADSGLLLDKTTADYLDITPAFEWLGPTKTATISIKAGYRDWFGGFSPKTGAYTRLIELPESIETPYSGQLTTPIRIPLTACGDISDGAIEVVLKIAGAPDYISHIWNVYATKVAVVAFRFSSIIIDGNEVSLTDHDADSGLLLEKTTADYLDITPAFEWQGPTKTATISIKAGHQDWAGGFSPETGAYTRSIELPESIETPYSDQLPSPIRIPLTACGDINDGAIEVVLKIAGVPDYISHIWNVYATEPAVPPEADIKDFDFRLGTGAFRIGDKVPFTAPYDYKGIAQSGQITISIGTGLYPAFITVHTFSPVPVNFAAAADWEHRSLDGQITLPDVLEIGGTYSVRAKLETLQIRTQETDTDWSAFEIYEEAPPPPPDADIRNFNFRAVQGTYRTDEKVPFTFEYEYKGKQQKGQMVLSLGTGVYPTFSPVLVYPPMEVSFEQAMDWAPAVQISGTFTLTSTLQPGQTYSVRAKLETLDDTTQETDTDWSAFTVSEAPVGYTLSVLALPLAAGWVTREPDKATYSYGETVKLTAHNAPGYRFASWWVNGQWAGSSTTLNVMVVADYEVIARFVEI